MPAKILSPKEKRRVERLRKNIRYLVRKSRLSDNNRFILRQQIKVLLALLGGDQSDVRLRATTSDIFKDRWPFKIRRLRKVIENGRRQSP